MMRWLLVLLLTARFAAAADPLSLPEAIRRSWQRHPSLAAAQAAARAADAGVAQAQAGRMPRVDFAETAMRGNNPVYVFGSLLTQRQFTAANFALPALNQPDFLNNFQSLLTAEQVLWDAGRQRQSTLLARLEAQRAGVGRQEVELALASRTARAYLDALLAEAALPVAEQAIRSAEADLVQARAVRDAGRSTDADVLSVEVHVAQTQQTLIARRADVVMARAALNELTGEALDAAPPLTTTLQPPSAGAAAAAPQRPEQERARLDSELARQRTVLAKLAWRPQVSLRAAFEADRQRFVTRAGANWMGGVTLRWNLFDGGAQRANVRGAVETERAATSQAAAVDARVKREVFQAQAQLDSTRARVAVAEKSVAAAAESLRITRDRYGAGLATVTDLLRTETAALETKLHVLAAQHGVRAALLNLAVAQGSLSPEAEILQ